MFKVPVITKWFESFCVESWHFLLLSLSHPLHSWWSPWFWSKVADDGDGSPTRLLLRWPPPQQFEMWNWDPIRPFPPLQDAAACLFSEESADGFSSVTCTTTASSKPRFSACLLSYLSFMLKVFSNVWLLWDLWLYHLGFLEYLMPLSAETCWGLVQPISSSLWGPLFY